MRYKAHTNELAGDLSYEHGSKQTLWIESDNELYEGELKYAARKAFLEKHGYTRDEGYESHMSGYTCSNGCMWILLSVLAPHETTDMVSFYSIIVEEKPSSEE